MTVEELIKILQKVKFPGVGGVYVCHRKDRHVMGGTCEPVVTVREAYENYGQFIGVQITYDDR